MDDILEPVRDFVEAQIDFEGQRLVELIATALLVIIGAISFIVGYFLQDIKFTLFAGLGASALTFLVVTPAWPFYNKNPVKFLPAGYAAELAARKSAQ